MQEVGWEEGRFVVIVDEASPRAASQSATVHDMANAGHVVKRFKPQHGWGDPVAKAHEEAERLNEDDRAGIR